MTDSDALPPEELTPADRLFAPADRMRSLRRLPDAARNALATVRRAAPRPFYIAFALQVASAVLVGAQLLVVKLLVADLVHLARSPDYSVADLVPAFAAIVAATAGLGLLAALLRHQQQLLQELVGNDIIAQIIDAASRVELARFEDPTFYDELERAQAAGLGGRPTQMVNSLMSVLLGVLTSLGVLVALVALEPLLVPFVALAGVPPLLATLSTARKTYVFEYAMTSHARERLHLFELFTERESAKELRVFAATAFLRGRYDALTRERVARFRAFLRARLRVGVLGALAGACGGSIALAALVWLLGSGRTSVATAATAVVAMQVLSGRLNAVVSSLGTLVESAMFIDDLDRFLALEARPWSLPTRRGGRLAGTFDSLEVESVSFAYPSTNRRVLDDVSLELRRGEVVALVGENGSGKTTLVKILCQLYEPDQGSVRWNGADVRDLDAEDLRSHLTVLFQDFVRYHLSAADNIALGRSERPREPHELELAARRAGIHEALAQLDGGYEARLGRQFLGGHELSGGQWQRLALARAFYRGGDLLVLDEPTAALDPRAEYALFERMRELASGKSVLLISHRFANVRMADRIYVLDRGRVVESGDHVALLAENGLYAELFRLQASSYVER